jgi:hypothetical protein
MTPFWVTTADLFVDGLWPYSWQEIDNFWAISISYLIFFVLQGGSNMFKHMFEHVYPILSAPLFGPPPCETAVNIT